MGWVSTIDTKNDKLRLCEYKENSLLKGDNRKKCQGMQMNWWMTILIKIRDWWLVEAKLIID